MGILKINQIQAFDMKLNVKLLKVIYEITSNATDKKS